MIKERFPSVKMQPDCGTVVSALWDEIKAKCPKGRESMQTLDFPPEGVILIATC